MTNIFKKNYSSAYVKMLISVILMIDIIILLFAGIMYSYYKTSSKREIDALNMEIVTLVQNNIDYMGELVDNYVMSEFYREDTSKLMNSKNRLSVNESNLIINRITASKDLQSLVDDVGIYNGNIDEVYAVNSNFREKVELRVLMEEPSLKAFKPYLVFDSALTYIIYKGKNDKGRPDGAMIVNVSLDWLERLIKSNNIDYANMYLVDEQGKVVLDVNGRFTRGEKLDREYADELINIKTDKKNRIYKIDEKQQAIAYSFIPSMDMTFVVERDYDTLYSGVKKVGRGTFLLTLLFLVFGVILSFFVGDKMYSPIRGMINNMCMIFEKDDDYDDFEYLENVIVRLKGGTEIANTLTKNNMLREFLTNPLFFDEEMRRRYIDSEDFFGGTNVYYMLILDTIEKDVETKRYLVKRIMSKLGSGLVVENTEEETLLVFKGRPDLNVRLLIEDELKGFTDFFVFIGESVAEPAKLSEIYVKSKALFKYRELFEDVHCLSEDTINMNKRNEKFEYPEAEQKALLEICRTGTKKEMDECFDAFINKIIRHKYEDYYLALMRVTFVFLQEYPFLADNDLQKSILIKTSIKEVKKIFGEAFFVIYIKNNTARNMNKTVVDSMKEYIEINISDFELCSKSLATEFNMSQAYVGRIFRENEQMSVADYITDIRMKIAARLLTSTTINITSIMEKVGYDNKSKFYRHFKTYYGITPKEYRVEYFEVDKINNEE